MQTDSCKWVEEKAGFEAGFQMAITKAQIIKTGILHSEQKFQITLFKTLTLQ